MSLWQRIKLIFKSKANKIADKYENPDETLDYAYTKQLELLRKVKTGLTDVSTSRKRIEIQVNKAQADAEKLTLQAQKAIDMGREDLAREALTRKAAVMAQVQELDVQRANLQAEEEKLINASQQLQRKVDSFRVRKETVKATYKAAQAQVQINESISGIGDEFGSAGAAIQRAEDKAAEMQARAGALDELVASGALEDPTRGDDIARELDALSANADVEAELARMKGLDSAKAVAPPVEQPVQIEAAQLHDEK